MSDTAAVWSERFRKRVARLYTDPKDGNFAFASLKSFRDHLAESEGYDLSLKQLREILRENVPAYSRMADRRDKISRRVFIADTVDQIWQADSFKFAVTASILLLIV